MTFHARSRVGLSLGTKGATYRFDGVHPPAPALRPDDRDDGRPRFALTRPTAGLSTPLGELLDPRHSTRRWGDDPIAVEWLGALLFHAARVVELVPYRPGPHRYEITRRTYPNGGAAYELEIYLTVRTCAGLPPGMYRYQPLTHTLASVGAAASACDAVVRNARRSMASADLPQVVATLASRFNRLSWKYEGIAYAITLRNAGVLYGRLYDVARALGIAVCGLGNGDSSVFAEATGLDPAVESSVGELALGSLPAGV